MYLMRERAMHSQQVIQTCFIWYLCSSYSGAPFYKHILTNIQKWICNRIHSWDAIIHSCPDFKSRYTTLKLGNGWVFAFHCFMHVSLLIHGPTKRIIHGTLWCNVYKWWLVCQKQVSRAGTSNYIPHLLWDVITCPRPWYLLLAYGSLF